MSEESRRRRTRRKSVRFKRPPKPAIAVRGLWEQASEEERSRAHEQCMAILAYWMGQKTKAETARELEVAPLRVWQMSQQALSGMLAGLLRQPKRRGKLAGPPPCPEDDPKVLRRRIEELEKQLRRTEDLVRVLKDLPWKQVPKPAPEEAGHADRRTSKRGRKTRRGVPAFSEHEDGSRSQAGDGRAAGREGSAGAAPGSAPADAARLEEAG